MPRRPTRGGGYYFKCCGQEYSTPTRPITGRARHGSVVTDYRSRPAPSDPLARTCGGLLVFGSAHPVNNGTPKAHLSKIVPRSSDPVVKEAVVTERRLPTSGRRSG